MIVYKSPEEIDEMRRAGKIVADTIDELVDRVRPGITTRQLDELAERSIRSAGAVPSFKGYRGFPASICTSLNDEVVHGIPGKQRVGEGDILKLDVGAIWEGFHADSAVSVYVGDAPSDVVDKLLRVTEESLAAGISELRAGGRLSDVGHAVQQLVEGAGFAVVRDLGVDIAGHVTGGPIPMPEADMERVVNETDCYLEIASAGNYRMTVRLIEMVRRKNALHRVTLGTDTPSGTGILPRGMLRNMNFLASVCGLTPEEAVCVATGNTAAAHGLDQGRIEPGRAADLVLMGRITASVAKDGLDALRLGDLPGISMVFVDGVPLVRTRSEQTPPPETPAVIEKGG